MIDPLAMWRASERIVSARAGMTPARSMAAFASCAGVGNKRSSPPIARNRRAEHRGDSPGYRRRRANRDLLTEDRPDRELEAVPRARRSNAGMLRQRPAQQRIRAEVVCDDRRVCAEIEHASHALDDAQQGPRIGKAHIQMKRVDRIEAGHVDDTTLPVNLDRAPIVAFLDVLDAWRGSGSEKVQHGVPVVGWAVRQSEPIALRIGNDGPHAPSQLGRRPCVGASYLAVEAAKTRTDRATPVFA